MTRSAIAETLSETLGYVEIPDKRCNCEVPGCTDCRSQEHAVDTHRELRNIIAFLAATETAEAWATVTEAFKDYRTILKAIDGGREQALVEALDLIEDPAEALKDLEEALEILGKASL
jgi:hypothetical protein